MSYGYVDLDGNTAVITKAADWAAQRGMLVVTSAGNEGRGKWRHITVPADADSVLTVGAVDRDGYYARFSSQGFGGERVKPNVVARGKFAIIAMESVYDTRPTMGTSFSSPIMAGAATCLWQAFPKRNNMELIQALEQSASQAATPDSLLGYGVPDVYVAYQTLAEQSIAIPSDSLTLTVPNIVHDNLHLFLASEEATSGTWQLTNMLGQELATAPLTLKATPLNYLNLPSWEAFNAGYYFLTVELPNRTYRLRILKA